MSFFKKHFGELHIQHNATHGLLVDFSIFLGVLKTRSCQTDSVKFRKANVERTIKGYMNGIVSLQNSENGSEEQWVTSAGILKYIFRHSGDIALCSMLAKEVDSIVCDTDGSDNSRSRFSEECQGVGSQQTILELYKVISRLSLRDEQLEAFYTHHLQLNQTHLPTLYLVHKDCFTENEWKKIMYFEHHYALIHGNDPQKTVEAELEKRSKYLGQLIKAMEMKADLLVLNKKTIQSRNLRKESAEARTHTQMQGVLLHLYGCLDKQLQAETKKYSLDLGSLVTIPSTLSNHVSICFDVPEEMSCDLCDIYSILSAYLHNKHSLGLDRLFVIAAGTFRTYYRKELKGYARFILHDDILLEKVRPLSVYIEEHSQFEENENLIDSSAAKCECCFQTALPRPLDISSFSLLQEWIMDVPLTMQLLLESSLAMQYFKESSDKQRFLQPKLLKLYMCYDTMLNNLNHKHTGLLQQANTLELIMHSKCLRTVFQVASSSGIAMSLSSAGRYLENNTVDNLLYYNTYLKTQPLTYKCKGLQVTTNMSLRDCIIILMVDNLVRLKYRDDPNPGENRSKQMNTLPITLQGIPLDSDEVASWHLDTCDGSLNCGCKESPNIPAEDLIPLMVTLLPDEEKASKAFSQLCTWGYQGLWKQLLKGDFFERIESVPDLVSPSKSLNQISEDATYLEQSPSRWWATRDDQFGEQASDNCIPTSLQSTPVSVKNNSFNTPIQTSCSTPVQQGSLATQVRPFAFNTMSPLQSRSVDIVDADFEADHPESQDVGQLHASQDEDETDCLANVIADAIRDGYDLRSEHADELNLSYFTCMQEENTSAGECDTSQGSVINHSESSAEDTTPTNFGFKKYLCPELLTRHPPPATGKDDDPDKLKEILDDIILKMGHHEVLGNEEKIIFGPDHKIGKNLLTLRKHNPKYSIFLPEFPLLHVRKHKITILFSAYKDVGLVQLLHYMQDIEEEDWRKLLSAEHIDIATRHIRRLSGTFHIAFLITFIRSLPPDQKEQLLSSLEKGETSTVCQEWGHIYEKFIERGCSLNATFCLHVEMMKHLDDVVAVSLAERLGGPSGYNLLLSSLKSSLLFSFLNGAACYAPYTMQLILEHYTASHFHQAMKMALYSTPHPGSSVNFSGDTKREMDHLDALKGFRSGSTISSVSKRMALVDSFKEVHMHYNTGYGLSSDQTDKLGWEMSATDWKHIMPTVAVVLRRGGISLQPSEVPKNVYAREAVSLDPVILDSVSAPVGLYLLQKSACKLGLLGLTVDDIPEPHTMTGPKHLVKKVACSKATTIRRSVIKTVSLPLNQSQEDKEEEKRQKGNTKRWKQIQKTSSKMNMCQALVHHDCKKPKIQKSQTVPTALLEHVDSARAKLNEVDLEHPIIFNTALSLLMSSSTRQTAQVAIIEFAGIKYKVKSSMPSGKSYIESVQNSVLLKFLNYLPSLQSIVVCEEKYDFTPDVLKSATRDQRSVKPDNSISHLKTGDEILGDSTFSKSSIVSTQEGKVMISNYLAAKALQLDIHRDVELIIDSGLKTLECNCTSEVCESSCKKYAVPLRCTFSAEKGLEKKEDMPGVKQRKGEGEMSQIDWLLDASQSLVVGRSAISIVTSGDIDAIILHLLIVALRWPRNDDGKFANPVYVLLAKPFDRYDSYCITSILETLERATGDVRIGVKIAVGLCIGGNDFLPRYNFYGTHSKVLRLLIRDKDFLENLIKISADGRVSLDENKYQEFVKQLYLPKQNTSVMSFDQVRKSSIIGKDGSLKDADKWLPPATCIKKMANLTAVVIEYLMTAGAHDAALPNFRQTTCFTVTSSGQVMYDFGSDSHQGGKMDEWRESLIDTPVKHTSHGSIKRGCNSTPSVSRKQLFKK